jgi:hypothetical protein
MKAPGRLHFLLGRRQSAQSAVEFALVLPFFVTILMVALQLSFLFMAQLVIVWMAMDNVRHAATSTSGVGDNWALADSCQTPYRNSKKPAIIATANITTFSFSPAYSPTTSNCSSATGNSPATTRQRGAALRLTIQYNPSNLLFLPSTFLGVPIITTLPAYTATAMME